MPLTGTVETVTPPSKRLKQSRGSPGTSGEGSANAAAANSRAAGMARASMRPTMIAAGCSLRGGVCLAISGEIDGFRAAGAVLLLGKNSGMIIGSNNEDIDFHR